eukprot:m.462907 g.462907  ORF g.462907 m.462907 type:complete len:208 (-) comp57026_c0_seq5:185-808(-)
MPCCWRLLEPDSCPMDDGLATACRRAAQDVLLLRQPAVAKPSRISRPNRPAHSPRLQEFLMEGQHYELIPKAGWELLVQWYTLAPDCEPICRKAIGPDVAPTVEITLLTIKAAVYTDLRTPVPLEISRETSLRHLKSLMCVQFEYPDDDTTQLWTVLYGRPSERLHRLHKLIRESYMIRGELVMIEMQNPDGTWPSDARFAQPAPAP